MNIVLINNDQNGLDELSRMVQTIYPGSGIEAFRDPMLAVKHVYNNDTDLVLSEIKTRPVNGFDVLRNLHKIKPEMLVVLLSPESTYADKANEYGADGFLTHPLDTAALRNVLESLTTGERRN